MKSDKSKETIKHSKNVDFIYKHEVSLQNGGTKIPTHIVPTSTKDRNNGNDSDKKK